ncbi:tetratricopeptide repeat protein [Streptomyces acidicola]|uniref:Tetratricopeptide repeat protein n=1 Tax=Streptomyces acidicola TaxID=2596892 RepID=A0A5N8X464_9ACTN|nr:tetratricopeptide repeat protein [Streptomyces acidicola]MPY54363.1 tetratricopeptide repeat protein [Streptomyces acidicola]
MSTDLFGVRVLDLDHEQRRVRFRVFVVYYEPSWGTGELLPGDSSFFFRVLWEAAEDFTPHRYGPLTDVVTLDEFLNEGWVESNTHRFVAGVERVAVRNHSVSDEDFERLAMFYYEREGGWQDEEQLAQGDYDVHVTDARWMESLRVGQSWGTTSYAGDSDGLQADSGKAWEEWEERCAEFAEDDDDLDACFTLGWLRQERGDAEGAAEAYRRVADGPDRQLHGKALLYLGDLHAAQGEYESASTLYQRAERSKNHERYGTRYRSRAALRLGLLLRRLGRDEEAQAAFARAISKGDEARDLGVVAEARRLSGAESPVEAANRLFARGERDGARAVLAENYGQAVVEVAGHLFAGDFEAAGAALSSLAESAGPDAPGDQHGENLGNAAALLVDLSMTWWREREGRPAMAQVLQLAVATGRAVEGYRRVVRRTGFAASASTGDAAEQLLTVLYDRGDEAAVIALATAAEAVHPKVASDGFRRVGIDAARRDDFAKAARWFERGATVAGADEDTRAHSAYRLGLSLCKLGETERAQEAFTQAEAGFERFGNAAMAAQRQAELAHAQGDRTAAFAAWARAAMLTVRFEHDEKTAARAVRLLGRLLTEVDAHHAARAVDQAVAQTCDEAFLRLVRALTKTPGVGPALYAAFLYGHWMLEQGDARLGLALLEKVAEGKGKYAAGAAVTVGADAHRGGDNVAAREWWLRALAKGNKEMSHKAVLNLGLVAKQERNLPELLEHYGPIAESDHEDGPLFAAHIGELHYWLEDWDEAARWYQRTLEGTDDGELVGEAGYRVGEILHGKGESDAALPCLRRAAASGLAPFAEQAENLLARLG